MTESAVGKNANVSLKGDENKEQSPVGLSLVEQLAVRIAELEPLEKFMQAWGEKHPSELNDEDFIADVKRDIAKCTKDRIEFSDPPVDCDHCHTFARLLQMATPTSPASSPEATTDGVSIDPLRQEGLPCITGTRIPVHRVLWAIAQTGSIDGAMRSYPALTAQQIKDALYFAQKLAATGQTAPSESVKKDTEAICIACGEPVELCHQSEHLRINHGIPIGGFRFWMGARRYFSEKPSMLVADLRKQCDVSLNGHFVQDVDGKSIYYSDGQAVDLTREPHFFILLPATY